MQLRNQSCDRISPVTQSSDFVAHTRGIIARHASGLAVAVLDANSPFLTEWNGGHSEPGLPARCSVFVITWIETREAAVVSVCKVDEEEQYMPV